MLALPESSIHPTAPITMTMHPEKTYYHLTTILETAAPLETAFLVTHTAVGGAADVVMRSCFPTCTCTTTGSVQSPHFLTVGQPASLMPLHIYLLGSTIEGHEMVSILFSSVTRSGKKKKTLRKGKSQERGFSLLLSTG